MLSEREVSAAIGSTAYGADGDKLGTVEHFFVDDRTGAPTWVAVTTGLFGTRHSLVPVQSASFGDGRLVLPVSREAVRSSPDIGQSTHLGPDEEAQLRRHYGLEVAGAGQDTRQQRNGPPADELQDTQLHDTVGQDTQFQDTQIHDTVGEETTGQDSQLQDTVGQDTVGQGTVRQDETLRGQVVRDDTVRTDGVPPVPHDGGRHAVPDAADDAADGAMIRSEERLRVDTEQVAARRVRLVRYVVTEEVQITVPIRREEIRVEEVPLGATDEGAGLGAGESLLSTGDSSGGLPDEMILHTERPVVSVEVVPVERVRLRTEVVQGSEQVTGQVQRERIVVDQDRISGTAG